MSMYFLPVAAIFLILPPCIWWTSSASYNLAVTEPVGLWLSVGEDDGYVVRRSVGDDDADGDSVGFKLGFPVEIGVPVGFKEGLLVGTVFVGLLV